MTPNTTTIKSPDFSDLVVGVLELQGDFAEHTAMLQRCGVGHVTGVRQASDLKCPLDALVLPGGESTTISKLLVQQEMMPLVKELANDGMPMFGTCAGCILLASTIRHRPEQPRIAAMRIDVDRNAYGRQINSFEAHVDPVEKQLAAGGPLRVVHIRAPAIVKVEEGVEVLASYKEQPILVRDGSCLACTFHPELTRDIRVHSLFLSIVSKHKLSRASN